MLSNFKRGLYIMIAMALCTLPVFGQSAATVEDIFETDHRNGLVMRVEAAIANGQADLGIIPRTAADEIAHTATTDYAPLDKVTAEYAVVRHRMVALLNVWRRSLSEEASDALHFGVTTVDVYDTVLVLQLLASTDLFLAEMAEIEQALVCLASDHRDTPMMGRTLGQHALPITFGKKSAIWAAQARRNMDRLYEVRGRLQTSGILKGAVGSYVGLGDQGLALEARVADYLGLGPPEPADWRPARDVFAEYAQTLALIAKSHATIGGEVFRLQMTDIGELYERRPSTAVGSSTMPHKRNPSLSEALIHYGRTVPAYAEIILDDVESVFERDNTSRPNGTVADISLEAGEMLKRTRQLIERLEINEAKMRANIDRTDGMALSQNVMLFLAPEIGRESAEEHVRSAAERAMREQIGFREALMADETLGPLLEGSLDDLLDPLQSLGLAGEQVDATISWISAQRVARSEPALSRCGG